MIDIILIIYTNLQTLIHFPSTNYNFPPHEIRTRCVRYEAYMHNLSLN